MTCYAIKHLPTGGYLPQRERRGHTFEEPRVGCVPRLFAREQSAKLALSAWLQGKWVAWRGQTYFGEYDEDITVKPQADRKPEEMAVVKIVIRERP